MAIKTVSWTSFGRLSCSGCTPADVILCTTFNDATVDAQLISTQRLTTGCGGGYFQYTFTYDSEKLPDGVTGLTCANITNAVCKGCLTQWVTNQLAGLSIDVALQIALAIAAARPLIFNSGTRDAVFSFLADPSLTHDVDLVIANPSSTRPLEVDISWGSSVVLQSSDQFVDTGVSSALYIDSVLIANTTQDASAEWAQDGIPALFDFAAPGGHYHLTVAAGASVTATARFSSATVGTPNPDIAWAAENMFVSAYGVTS